MPDPLRSPKQSRTNAKTRSHPYARPPNSHRARDVGIGRSNSVLGTIKSFITAPLAWLSLGDSQSSDGSRQKRRVSVTERGGTPPRAKRARHDSPEGVGYLDPPSSIFAPKRPPIPLWNVANGVPPARTMSIDPPPPSMEPAGLPLPPSRGPSILSRASMSVEPQDPFPIRRSTTRDLSMPPPSPFARSYSRSSLTPQPAGATFGPSPKRRARESTAPPLLGSPAPAPTFTRPPPSNAVHSNLFSRAQSQDPISTLLGRTRQPVSPMRETPTRNMLVGDERSMSRSPSKTTAERTLSSLEGFRTPLHVSRFPSVSLADEHRPRKVHVPMPSKLGFDHTPDGKREKVKRGPAVIGPYSSGMSGMRKLLARRREELEKEKTEEQTELDLGQTRTRSVPDKQSPVTDDEESRKDEGEKEVETEKEDILESRRSRAPVNGVTPKTDTTLPRSKGDSYSSLRAPSSRVSRTHAPAPKLKKTRNKFSLNDEDEEEQDWNMSVEELKNYQAKTQSHISFSTTRSMSETGMQTDLSTEDAPRTRAMSPPLPAQPQTFDSLLSRIGPSAPNGSKPVTVFPSEPPKTDSGAKPQSALPPSSEASTAPVTLPFSFGASNVSTPAIKPPDAISSPFASASTPMSGSSAAVALPTPTGGIPSFFANTKSQFTPPKVPSGSLFGSPTFGGTNEKGPSEGAIGEVPTQRQEEKQEQLLPKEAKPSPFGGFNKPSSLGEPSTSAFGAPSPAVNAATATTLASVAPPFNGFTSAQASGSSEASKPAFSFGAPAVNGTDAAKPSINIFGAAKDFAAPTTTSNSSAQIKPPFSFNAPPSLPSQSQMPIVRKPEVTSMEPATDAPSKPAFSFGVPSTPSASQETPKTLFSFATSTQSGVPDAEASKSPFSFGAAPSTPPPAEKKPAFPFGAMSGTNTFSTGSGTTTNTAGGPIAEAPKSLFGGFGGASTTAVPSTPKLSESTADNGGDRMEVAGDRMEESPTRHVDKKDTASSQLPQSSPFAGFGGGGSSPGFSFAQPKAAPTNSAFSFGQSKPDSAPGFGFAQSRSTSTTGAGTNAGFNFGTDATKITGQSQSVFGAPTSAFGASTSDPTSSTSFPFGQPSTSSNANPFGQPQPQPDNGTSTAPNSPSLFSQPTSQAQTPSPSFAFTLPAPASSFGAPKPDGAAPSSPTSQPFQFGSPNASQQQQQSSAAALNSMFTLGGAATPPPRKVKGLPTRRAKRP